MPRLVVLIHLSNRHSKNVVSSSHKGAQSTSLSTSRSNTLEESPPGFTTMQVVEARDYFECKPNPMTRNQNIFQAKAIGITDSKTLRSKRYRKAERELIDTFTRCRQERSLQELQVASLKRAISTLNSRIVDSKERLDQLRTLLADRGIEPDLYRAMQRERWMEERRQLYTIDVSKVLEQRLSLAISSLLPSSTSEAEGRSEALASRSTSNLVKFLESPRRRIPTRSRARRRVYAASMPLPDQPNDSPVQYQEGVLSSQKNFSVIQTESNPTISTTLSPTPTTPHGSPALPNSAVINVSQLAPVDENMKSQPEGDTNQHSSEANGCITIWRDPPRSKEDILAGLVVDMPDYVNDLLSGLDSTSYIAASLHAPQEVQTPRSTFSRTSFVPDTPRSQRSPGTPSRHQVHKSPSRKRISALFSLPEALSSRRTVNAESDRPKHITTSPTAKVAGGTSPRPFSVSFSGLPSSDSGGSHDHGADYKAPSRLKHRLSFFKRH
ncbi:hypothetical protein CVT25_006994 [Psilocybe cyanescens]|uniref:Uncharacterized protein n=1 Tax=Psilocybe cyanescens TaxID=93625 RepID=A0A409WYA0_PSICY|nr:hypothetical protein CVT25_006994 [Psilocybe cyanescens]